MKKFILALSLFLVAINILPVVAQNLNVKNFDGIVAGGPIQVIVTMGNTESLKFEGDAAAISTLVAEVKGGILIIRPQTSWTSWAHKYENAKIIARVNAKNINSLTMSGNGSMKVNGEITASDLAITLSGSGSIAATADVTNFTGVLSGSGKMNVFGKTQSANINISGSGAFANKNFQTDNLSAKISGSGAINISVEESIKAVILGSGRVNYIGNPSIEKNVVGSGSVEEI
jgi:hypothetical protein